MAITLVEIQTPSGLSQFTDTSLTNSADGIKSSSAVLYSVLLDNSANAGASTYVKLFNVASGSVVVGTTAPDQIIFLPASAVITVFFFTGSAPGMTFATALSACAVTTGGTAGNTGPSSSVKATFNFV